MTTNEEAKHHTNAIDLIVAAAAKSGLLKEVAEALAFIDQNPCVVGSPPVTVKGAYIAEAIRDDLINVFDDNICLAALTPEGSFYPEGICIGPFTQDELKPYLTSEGASEGVGIGPFTEFELARPLGV